MINKTKKYKTTSHYRTKRKYHKKKLLMKRKKQVNKKQSKKQKKHNKLNNKIKSRKRGGQKTQTQILLERNKKSQSNKQKAYNARETKAINKFRLGIVNYHKGPIEIFIKSEKLPVSFDRLKKINLKFSEMLEDIELDYSLRGDDDKHGIIEKQEELFDQQNAGKYIWYGIGRGHRRSDENKESKINGYIIHGTIEISDNFSHLDITNICGFKGPRDSNRLITYLMSEKNDMGQKIWDHLFSPVSSEMITTAFSQLGEQGVLDLNGYHSEIKLLEVLFNYMFHNESDTDNITFKNFKRTLFSDNFNFDTRDTFPFFWMDLENMIKKYNEEMEDEIEEGSDIGEDDNLLTSLDIEYKDDKDDNDDLLLSGLDKKIMMDLDINKNELDELYKLTKYLNDNDKFKTDGDFSSLFDNILNKYKNQLPQTSHEEILEKLKKLARFENQMNDPVGMFVGIINRRHAFDISMFQKWFDKNSVLFNQYLFPDDDNIKSFEQCPKLNKCYIDEESKQCNIYPDNLRPSEEDRLLGSGRL